MADDEYGGGGGGGDDFEDDYQDADEPDDLEGIEEGDEGNEQEQVRLIGAIFESIVLFYLGNNRNCRINFVFFCRKDASSHCLTVYLYCVSYIC